MNTVEVLPIWKKDAPTHERLYELAELARRYPERFDKWVFVYCEDNDQRFKTRLMERTGQKTSECLAVLTAGLQTYWEETRRES